MRVALLLTVVFHAALSGPVETITELAYPVFALIDSGVSCALGVGNSDGAAAQQGPSPVYYEIEAVYRAYLAAQGFEEHRPCEIAEFGERFSSFALTSMLTVDSKTRFHRCVYSKDGEPVGYVQYETKHNNEEIGYVDLLDISKKYQGKGLGSTLLVMSLADLLSRGRASVELIDASGKPGYYEQFGFGPGGRQSRLKCLPTYESLLACIKSTFAKLAPPAPETDA